MKPHMSTSCKCGCGTTVVTKGRKYALGHNPGSHRNCGAIEMTKEIRKKISVSVKKYCTDNPTVLKQRGKHLSKLMLTQWSTPSFSKKRLVAINAKRHKHGWVDTDKGGRIYYQSSWERIFVEILDASSKVKSFKRTPFAIPYKYKKITHSFYPDFIVKLFDGRKVVFELKGRCQEIDKYKFKAAQKFCKEKLYLWAPVFECPKGVSRYIQ